MNIGPLRPFPSSMTLNAGRNRRFEAGMAGELFVGSRPLTKTYIICALLDL